MKCISLWQPWASGIVLGLKQYETRGWSTSHRGPIAIHAAKRWTPAERRIAAELAARYGYPELADPPRGVILGTARIVAVLPSEALVDEVTDKERDFGDYAPDRYGWLLQDVVAFRNPVPYIGMQGMFTVPAAILENAA